MVWFEYNRTNEVNFDENYKKCENKINEMRRKNGIDTWENTSSDKFENVIFII